MTPNPEELLALESTALDDLMLSREADKISTELEGETVILDLASGVYSGLDAVGTSVWNILEQPTTFSDLCRKIMEEYEVDADACRADLLAFVKELVANKLITVANDAVA